MQYEADDYQVTLNIYDGTFDHRTASMIAEWTSEGVVIGLSRLLWRCDGESIKLDYFIIIVDDQSKGRINHHAKTIFDSLWREGVEDRRRHTVVKAGRPEEGRTG